MTEPVREPKLIAPTRHIHAIWESNNPVVPEGVLCITKDRLYTGSVEYFIGDGTNPYTLLPKFGMNSQEGTASDTVAGMIELATPDEVKQGTDNERAVTPKTLTDKILGTVSQTGGVPTGAVIERGSNANGEYIKFADGTMICTQFISSANNGLTFTKDTVSLNWNTAKTLTFPAEFSENPKGLSASVRNGTGIGWASVREATTTTIQIGIYDDKDRSGQAMLLSYTAIGRWY